VFTVREISRGAWQEEWAATVAELDAAVTVNGSTAAKTKTADQLFSAPLTKIT
jgi:post-segregation antitoxin (ccd killing protein)